MTYMTEVRKESERKGVSLCLRLTRYFSMALCLLCACVRVSLSRFVRVCMCVSA